MTYNEAMAERIAQKLKEAIVFVLLNMNERDVAMEVKTTGDTVSCLDLFTIKAKYDESPSFILDNDDEVWPFEFVINYALEKCINLKRKAEVAAKLFKLEDIQWVEDPAGRS